MDSENFFNDISPDDFIDMQSHRMEVKYEGDVRGEDLFDLFTLRNREATITAYEVSNGEILPYMILHCPEFRRLYVCDEDETLEGFFGRMRREAQMIGATWVYGAMVNTGAAGADDLPVFTKDNLDEAEELIREGRLAPMILWYAEASEPEITTVRFGVVRITDGGRTGAVVEDDTGDPTGATYLFREVLGNV